MKGIVTFLDHAMTLQDLNRLYCWAFAIAMVFSVGWLVFVYGNTAQLLRIVPFDAIRGFCEKLCGIH